MIVEFQLLETDARKTVSLLRTLSDPMAAHLARRIESQIKTSEVKNAHQQWTAHVESCVQCNAALHVSAFDNWVDRLCPLGKTFRNALIEAKKEADNASSGR